MTYSVPAPAELAKPTGIKVTYSVPAPAELAKPTGIKVASYAAFH